MMNRSGLAIVTMLIFSVIFTILAGVILGLMSNATRDLESHVRGTKAFYTSEAGTVFALDTLRYGQPLPPTVDVSWFYDGAGNLVENETVAVASQAGSGPSGTDVLNVTTDFSI